jgi:c-di-GMP-binding flagellar brake protein YcgR
LAPNPNQNISLIIAANTDKVYPSRIEDITHDSLTIAAPMDRGKLLNVRPRTKVLISYTEGDLVEQGRYQAAGVVERRFRQNNVPMLLIRLTSEWEKIQQRDFVRVDVLIEGVYNGINKCIVKDLSGGGLLFAAEEKLENGTAVFIDLKLDQTVLRLYGKIVRVIPKESGYEYGVSYTNLDEPTRQLIIQYVYKRLIEIYRKAKKQKS